ncbi:MAG: CHAD domain-containing protein [Acidobacteriota bacterium]
MAKRKRIPGLHCSASADKMVRLVLRTQLKKMCSLRDLALDWSDPEGVHDMRVLSRRLRSAVSDFKPYLSKGTLPRLKLRAIARSLGAVRDEDVALIALDGLKAKAKEGAAEGIEILEEERRLKQNKARFALEKALEQTAMDDFRKDYLNKLRSIGVALPTRSSSQGANVEPAQFWQLGAGIIEGRLKEFTAASRFIYSPFEINQLHELRILAKRLRYAIELFATCWGDEMEGIAKEVAAMQTALGELHDCDVWIQDLSRRLRARSRPNEENHARLKEGATWLLSHFSKRRTEYYRDALVRWQRWESDGMLSRLKSILARDLSPAPPPPGLVSEPGVSPLPLEEVR